MLKKMVTNFIKVWVRKKLHAPTRIHRLELKRKRYTYARIDVDLRCKAYNYFKSQHTAENWTYLDFKGFFFLTPIKFKMNIKTQGYAALAVLSFYPYNCPKVSVLGLGNVSISFPRGRKPSKEADQNSHSLWKVERNFYIDLFLSNKVKKLTGSF